MSLKLTKRGDTYYVTGTIGNQRIRESAKTSDRRKAEGLLAKRTQEAWNRHIYGERETVTLAEAALIYCSGREFSPSYYDCLLKITDRLGARPLSSIDQRTMDDYIATYYPSAKPATIQKNAITPITAIMTAGAKRGWCDVPKFERPKQSRGRLRYLSRDEADRLISECADHIKPLVTFLIHTGARLGEALDLTWDDVDLSRRFVTFHETKNEESRSIPLNGTAFMALANLPEREGVVFRNDKGDPWSRKTSNPMKTGYSAACRRAGIKNFTVHDLRHTFASWLALENKSLRTIAELLGHKDLKMVMRYAHLSPGHLKEAVSAIDTPATQRAGDQVQSIEGKQ